MIPDEARSCIVKVSGAKIKGMGFLVDDEHILTCAHVVSPTGDYTNRFYERPSDTVEVTFLLNPEVTRTASVAEWHAPSDASCSESCDIAVLRLNEAKPEAATPANMLDAERCDDEFAAYGLYKGAYGFAYGKIRDRLHTGCFQIEHPDHGIFIQGGYSGTPVWDKEVQGFVGMVVSAVQADGIACVIPNSELANGWHPLSSLITKTSHLLACNLPYLRNNDFTGREELIGNLRAALTSGQPAARTQAITGMAGVGKTQLAVEYAYRFHADYPVIWWVRSEDPTTLAADYARFASEMNLETKNLADQTAIVDAVRRWLETNERWLLIFDNVLDQPTIYNYLPRTENGSIIITSRNPKWDKAEVFDLAVFDTQESIELLAKLTRQHDETAAAELALELGNLPLALAQAGAYCAAREKSLADYLALFRQRQAKLLGRSQVSEEYPTKVTTTLDIAWTKVRDDMPAAAALFNLFAFLAPDDIPLSLVVKAVPTLPPPANTLRDELDFEDAIDVLKRYALITKKGDSVAVHRLVQLITRDRLNDDAANWAEAAVTIIKQAFHFNELDLSTWSQCSRLLPHARAAINYSEECCKDKTPAATAALLTEVGRYLTLRAEFTDALSFQERAVKILKTDYGYDHLDVARNLRDIGRILWLRADTPGEWCPETMEATYYLDDALERFKRAPGDNRPDMAQCLHLLGAAKWSSGDAEESQAYLVQALNIRKSIFPSNHPDIAESYNALGVICLAYDDYDRAKRYFLKAIDILNAAHNDNHPNFAKMLNNLAITMARTGDIAQAKLCSERALKIYKANYSDNHPDVAYGCAVLGSMYTKLDDLDQAQKYWEEACRSYKACLGDEHRSTRQAELELEVIALRKSDIAGSKDKV